MLAGKKQIEKTVWAEYKGGFEVEIRYTPRAKLRVLSERAQVREWHNHQMRETLDSKKYSALVANEVVVGWRGLTDKVLRQMVLLDDYPPDVPFSIDECAWLLEAAYDFDLWVQNVATEVEYFDAARRAEEQKNSSPSPASS